MNLNRALRVGIKTSADNKQLRALSAVTKAPRSGSRVPPPQNGSSYLKGQFIHESFYNLPGSAAEGSSRILNDERGQEHHQDYFLPLALAHSAGRRDDSHHIIRAAVSDPKQIKKYPRCPHRPEQSDVAASPWRAVCLDMCACVSACAKRVCVRACMHVCVCGWTCVQGGVEQVPRCRFPAMSLKRAVKSLQQIPYIHLCQSARHTLGVYTGGNTIYLMLHCPHVQSPPPHTGDSQCLTSISYSEQAGRQAGKCRGMDSILL